MPIDAFNVLCAQLTRDLFAIAKFLLINTIVIHGECITLLRVSKITTKNCIVM